MIEIAVHSNMQVGLPKTPAAWVGHPQYEEITRVRMSCGGGMGGSQWFEYIERIPFSEFPANGLIEVKTVEGKTIMLNTAYAVQFEDFDLCTCVYTSRNPNFPMGVYTWKFLIEPGKEVRLCNEFDKEDDSRTTAKCSVYTRGGAIC